MIVIGSHLHSSLTQSPADTYFFWPMCGKDAYVVITEYYRNEDGRLSH
jgi:hypothetical protein